MRRLNPGNHTRLFVYAVLPVWIFVAIILVALSWQRMFDIHFPDQDDVLRMVQVRDWLNGQAWFDIAQHRMNLPEGAPIHWSRLVDLPIALFIQLFRLVLAPEQAEIAAAIVVPLLTLLALMTVLAVHAHRLFGLQVALFTTLITGFSLPIIKQLQPYRVDHHGWQLVCAALVMLGMFDCKVRRGGWIFGAAMATCLVISIEGLPLALGSITILGFAWVLRREGDQDGVRLESAAVSLALVSTFLWAVTRYPQGDAVWCDALSAFHLKGFAIAAVGIAATRRVASTASARLLGLGATAILAAAVLAISAPQCLQGAFTDLPPLVDEYWYRNVTEGLPLWDQDPVFIWHSIALLPLAAIGLMVLWREAPQRRGDWAVLGAMLGAATLVAVFVARAGGTAAVVAAPVAGLAAHRLFSRARKVHATGLRIIATALSLLLLLPGAAFGALIPMMAPAQTKSSVSVTQEDRCMLPRRLRLVGEVLDAIDGPRNVLAPLDMSPALLFATDATVVASGHHRNKYAMNDAISFWIGSPRQAEAIVRMRKIRYVVFCPGSEEALLYSTRAPQGMMARMMSGRAPAWIGKIEDPRLGPLQLYRVLSRDGTLDADHGKTS
jgi:hypothetical protein